MVGDASRTRAPHLDRRSLHCSNTAIGEYDVVIVGGGTVGMAVAREVLGRYPTKTVAVLEKEPEVGGLFTFRRTHSGTQTVKCHVTPVFAQPAVGSSCRPELD